MHDDHPSHAAPMIEALNARAHVAGAITLSDGTHVDVEGVARRAFNQEDREGRSVLVISLEGEDDAELNELERDDHGYLMVPLSALAYVPAYERWPAGGWKLDDDHGGAHVALMIRAHPRGLTHERLRLRRHRGERVAMLRAMGLGPGCEFDVSRLGPDRFMISAQGTDGKVVPSPPMDLLAPRTDWLPPVVAKLVAEGVLEHEHADGEPVFRDGQPVYVATPKGRINDNVAGEGETDP